MEACLKEGARVESSGRLSQRSYRCDRLNGPHLTMRAVRLYGHTLPHHLGPRSPETTSDGPHCLLRWPREPRSRWPGRGKAPTPGRPRRSQRRLEGGRARRFRCPAPHTEIAARIPDWQSRHRRPMVARRLDAVIASLAVHGRAAAVGSRRRALGRRDGRHRRRRRAAHRPRTDPHGRARRPRRSPPIPQRASSSRHSSCENALAIKCPRKP